MTNILAGEALRQIGELRGRVERLEGELKQGRTTMPITDRDTHVLSIAISGNSDGSSWERQATSFMEAARIILAERLHVQMVAVEADGTLVLYCDGPVPLYSDKE